MTAADQAHDEALLRGVRIALAALRAKGLQVRGTVDLTAVNGVWVEPGDTAELTLPVRLTVTGPA